MRNPTTRLLLSLASLLLIGGCSVTPSHEFDATADFASYQAWRWQAPDYAKGDVSDPILDSELLGKRVEAAVDATLETRGFTRNAGKPDFVVTYHTSKDLELYDSGPSFSIGLHQGWSRFHTGVMYDTRPTMSKRGVLIIDIIDADSDELVWRGWRELPLSQSNFDTEQVNRSVREILSAFPPETSNTR